MKRSKEKKRCESLFQIPLLRKYDRLIVVSITRRVMTSPIDNGPAQWTAVLWSAKIRPVLDGVLPPSALERKVPPLNTPASHLP
jgi:hypothetical protein